MKKQTKPKTPQPQKANETSFKPGDKAAEKWTFEVAKSFFEQAYELSKTEITLTNISNALDTYPDIFEYLVDKFPNFRTIKNKIEKQIENNTYTGAMKGELVPSVAIFGLKNNHGWKDKTEVDHTTKGQALNETRISKADIESIKEMLKDEF